MSMALHTGTKPLLMEHDQCLDWIPSYHDTLDTLGTLATQTEATLHHPGFPNLDSRIAQAWHTMTRFCSLVNLATEAHGHIPWEIFLATMASVMYPMQYLSFEAGSLDELVRLALLVVSSHVFLQWRSITVPFHHLAATYRHALLDLDSRKNLSSSSSSSRSNSWFFMIGAVTVFTEADNHWLRPRLKAHLDNAGIISWAEMQTALNSFLWVHVSHESLGQVIFTSLIDSQNDND